MMGLMFGEIAVRIKEITASDSAFQEEYDITCEAMKRRRHGLGLQDQILIFQKTQRAPKEEVEQFMSFKQILGTKLRSSVNRFILGNLLMDNAITAPFIQHEKSARGLIMVAKYLEFFTYMPEEMITC